MPWKWLSREEVLAVAGGGTPWGADTNIQFNDGWVFWGTADLTWDNVNKVFRVKDSTYEFLKVDAVNKLLQIWDSTDAIYSFDSANKTLNLTLWTGMYVYGVYAPWSWQYMALRWGNNVGAFVMDDDNQEVYFSNGASAKKLSLDYANNVYKIWDIDNQWNGIRIDIDDSAPAIKSVFADWIWTFEILWATSARTFLANPSNYSFQAWDVDLVWWGAILLVNSTLWEVKNAWDYYRFAPTGSIFNYLFEIDSSAKRTKIWDISWANNFTVFQVSDNSKTISSTLDGQFIVQNLSGKDLIYWDTSTREVYLGDTQNQWNKTSISINDPIKSITLNANNNTLLSINWLSQKVELWDTNSGNTIITVDYNSSIITTNATTTTIWNTAGGNSTIITVNDTTETITVSKPFWLQGYTVATLPTWFTWATAYVTDALAPVFGATVVWGWAVTMKVRYDGTNWIVW